MEIFSHESCSRPLAGAGEIRLLRLVSGKQGDPLSGQLDYVNLQQSLQYEALSYEWGSPEKKHSITLNDKYALRITDALRSQGASATSLDDGEIYRKATRVVTYIGPEKDNSSIAINFAYELWEYSRSQKERTDPRLHSVEELVNIGLPHVSDPRWAALKALLLRGWSSRCWCAQEFLMNRSLTTMCGRLEIPHWSLVPNIVHLAFSRSLPTFLLPRSQEDPHSLRECLATLGILRTRITYDKQPLMLRELLALFHPFRATDPRDKVYSLVGLASDRESIALTVDYTLTSEQLYTAVAIRIMEKSPSLEFLYSNFGKKSLKLPSWVPDWSTCRYGSHGMGSGYHYSASGSTTPDLWVNTVNQSLDIVGCFVDKIIRRGERIGPHYRNYIQSEVSERNTWLREQMKLAKQLEPYPDGSNMYNVFWRTLIGNITFEGEEAKDNYKTYFEAHLNFGEDSSPTQKNIAREFCDAVRQGSRYRRLAVTERGYFGVVPETAKIGDWVCMFHGGKHLFLVRYRRLKFTYLGHAYIHGLMSGEVLRSDWYKKQTITLV